MERILKRPLLDAAVSAAIEVEPLRERTFHLARRRTLPLGDYEIEAGQSVCFDVNAVLQEARWNLMSRRIQSDGEEFMLSGGHGVEAVVPLRIRDRGEGVRGLQFVHAFH